MMTNDNEKTLKNKGKKRENDLKNVKTNFYAGGGEWGWESLTNHTISEIFYHKYKQTKAPEKNII